MNYDHSKTIENLKEGDQLIFFRDGGVISAKKGRVFTFSNWFYDKTHIKNFLKR